MHLFPDLKHDDRAACAEQRIYLLEWIGSEESGTDTYFMNKQYVENNYCCERVGGSLNFKVKKFEIIH